MVALLKNGLMYSWKNNCPGQKVFYILSFVIAGHVSAGVLYCFNNNGIDDIWHENVILHYLVRLCYPVQD